MVALWVAWLRRPGSGVRQNLPSRKTRHLAVDHVLVALEAGQITFLMLFGGGMISTGGFGPITRLSVQVAQEPGGIIHVALWIKGHAEGWKVLTVPVQIDLHTSDIDAFYPIRQLLRHPLLCFDTIGEKHTLAGRICGPGPDSESFWSISTSFLDTDRQKEVVGNPMSLLRSQNSGDATCAGRDG